MKKIIFVLAVFVLTTSVWAGEVLITCAQVGDEPNVIVSYNNTEGQPVRAFALNITVDGGATIVAVECLNADYYIYPGSINIDGGEVGEDGWGSCVCDPGDYEDTLGGLDSNGVTIEMASLYAADDPEHTTAPENIDDLVKLTLSGNDTVCITIEGNVLRGKVVLEDATSVDPNALGCCAELPPSYSGCFPLGHPDWDEWDSVGQPDSWCIPRQCHGDADGLQELIGKFYYWVGYNDLNIFLANWMDKAGETAALQADFSHDNELIGKFYYRVGYNDLGIFLANWMDKAGSPDDCLDVP